MRLLNLHTAPMRHLIKFIAKTESWCDIFKVLHLVKFSEILHRYTTQHNVFNHQLKITFQLPDFVRKVLFICYKRQSPLSCESINFLILK